MNALVLRPNSRLAAVHCVFRFEYALWIFVPFVCRMDTARVVCSQFESYLGPLALSVTTLLDWCMAAELGLEFVRQLHQHQIHSVAGATALINKPQLG